jgi:hypothetical protein
MGGSSKEGAFSTARCRASMPDLQTEEIRIIPIRAIANESVLIEQYWVLGGTSLQPRNSLPIRKTMPQ